MSIDIEGESNCEVATIVVYCCNFGSGNIERFSIVGVFGRQSVDETDADFLIRVTNLANEKRMVYGEDGEAEIKFSNISR